MIHDSRLTIHVHPDPASLSQALAEWTTVQIETTLQQQDRFTFVLTGGNSPKLLYELLAKEPFRERISWDKLHIFWGDERAVPFEDSRNNARMTYEHLLDHVPVKKEQVHIMQTDLTPEASAEAYSTLLHQYFGETGPTFDLVLNGMGDDGHTLSLFPHTPVIHEQQKWVTSFYLDAQQMHRITLTAPVVNRAKQVVFLTFGSNKANALHEVIEGKRNVDEFPSQIIQPASGQLHWFVDEAAAGSITADTYYR